MVSSPRSEVYDPTRTQVSIELRARAASFKGSQPGFQYIAKAQPAIDMEVDTHYYDPLGSTGWHKHPGPVYITVTSGKLTFYEFDDPTCSPHVYSKGQGFVDFGNGHIGINDDPDNPASDVTVAVTYVGGPFRTELPAGNPSCSF